MKIILISDTHGLHEFIHHPLPKGDVLIHAGDVCNIGSESDVRSFIYWFQNLKGFDTKIFIAGNHDWGFERKEPWLYNYINDENLSQSDCVYLEDNEFTIETPEFSRPIKFYGSPWQPPFMNWAFNAPEEQLAKYWEKIPIDTDILITHGPAYGILDTVEGRRYEHLGSITLSERINIIKPKIHICGHIHSGRNILEKDGILFINASTSTESYDMINKPIVIDFDFKTNEWKLIDF